MRFDVLVIGAGSAGAAVSAFAAERGMSVLCLDRKPLDEAGARWVNGVPAWAFDEAGIARPGPEERLGDAAGFVLVAGWGPTRVVAPPPDAFDVDMRALVARLQGRALDAGARLIGGVRVLGVDGTTVHTSLGAVAAPHVVDASGVAGARVLDQSYGPDDLCAAAQEVRLLRDRGRARAFFEAHGATLDDTLCFTAVAGGYSIVSVRVVDDRVSLLTGSIPGAGNPSGAVLLARFAVEQRWIGEPLFGGARVIPLVAPETSRASPRIALVGDAAGQVFPAHGSGVGPQLVAARLLADALASGGGARAYASAYRRRFGLVHAVYGSLRRLTQRLDSGDVAHLIEVGLLDAKSVRAALEQRLPARSLARALPRLMTAFSEPRFLRHALVPSH